MLTPPAPVPTKGLSWVPLGSSTFTAPFIW